MSTTARTILATTEINVKSGVAMEDLFKTTQKASAKDQHDQLVDECDIMRKVQNGKPDDKLIGGVEEEPKEEDAKLKFEKNNDEGALWRWKQRLLGVVNPSTTEGCKEADLKILSVAIQCSGRSDDVVLPISNPPTTKRSLFTLKEGCRYRTKFSFTVSKNVVAGLKYVYTVWKTGVRVENTKIMLGTFSPKQEPYTYELEEATIPTGIFVRGSYYVRTKIVDEDGKCYFDFSYYFEIRKTWGDHN